MIEDFGERFQDLLVMDFPIWLTQFSLADVDLVEDELKDELADLRNDESVSAIHSVQRQLTWLHPEVIENTKDLLSVLKNFYYHFLHHILWNAI